MNKVFHKKGFLSEQFFFMVVSIALPEKNQFILSIVAVQAIKVKLKVIKVTDSKTPIRYRDLKV